MTIRGGGTFCYIPDAGSNSLQFRIEPEGAVEWILADGIVGVSLSPAGLLSVAGTVDVSAKKNKEHWVKVVAQAGAAVDTLPVVILREPAMSNVVPPAEERMAALDARLAELEKATGASGNPGEKGIAKRIDTLEARISTLEGKVG